MKIKFLPLYLFLFVGIYMSFFSFYVNAETVEQMKARIENANAEIAKIDREIAKYQDMIDVTASEKNSLAKIIKELTLSRSKLLAEKQKIEKQITKTGAVINTLNTNIKEKQSDINTSKAVIAKLIYEQYQKENITELERILSSDDLSNASFDFNSVLSVSSKLDKSIENLSEDKQELLISKTKKELEEKNLKNLKNNLIQKQKTIEVAKSEKDNLLKQTKNKEEEYKKLLAEQQKKRDEFEQDLRDYESKLKFLLNPKLLPTAGSGVFSWPLDKVYITQLFGKTSASGRLYASGSHSGVDFRAPVGTPVKSMGTGTVMGVGDTDLYCKGASFGKWVFIKYDNGLSSTYGHLSVIASKAGDEVVAGDIVGYSGNTGHSTGPHLHVTVYASQGAKVDTVPSISCSGKTFIMPIAPTSAYLDPMLYLPKATTTMVKK